MNTETETEILAFAASQPIDLPAEVTSPLPTSLVWMPAGRHAITASTMDGAGFSGGVICDEQAARAVSASYAKSLAAGQRIWIDFNHDDGEAAAWVKGFSWDASKGIMASVEWTAKGADALRGKAFYSFSPAFACERETGRIVGLLSNHAAGGLVNKPAFGAAMPALIAASAARIILPPTAADGPSATAEPTNMSNVTAPAAADAAAQVIVPAPVQASAAPSIVDFKAMIDGLNAKIDALKPAAPVAPVQASAAPVVLISPGVSTDSRATISVKAAIEDVIKGFAIEKNGNARGNIFKKEIAPVIASMGGRGFSEQLPRVMRILAANADVLAANSLGTLTGSLIAQQALSLLKYEFPLLGMISTDFSNTSADFNQTVITRLKSAISASQYTTGYTAADATLTNVPITINHHPYAQVAFNANELASTNRDLFGEQAEVVMYALTLDMANALYALITAGNFPTTALVLGTTGGGTATTDGTGYLRNSATNAAKKLFLNKVPRAGRFNLLNADSFGALAADPAVVSLAAFQKPEIITGYELPEIAGMQPVQVVNLPTTGNMVSFAGHARSLAIATRVPNDYTQALAGSNYGSVSTITDPDLGITVMVTQYVNHDAGTSNYRVALMYGVAVGDPVAGVITTHA